MVTGLSINQKAETDVIIPDLMRYIRSYEEERKKFSLDCHFYKKDYKKDDISIAFKKRRTY